MLSFVAAACAGPSDDRTVPEPAELRAHIAACFTPESNSGHLAEISFEPTNSTPAFVADFLSRSRLWSFGYQVTQMGSSWMWEDCRCQSERSICYLPNKVDRLVLLHLHSHTFLSARTPDR
jgi:hypothetical protein